MCISYYLLKSTGAVRDRRGAVGGADVANRKTVPFAAPAQADISKATKHPKGTVAVDAHLAGEVTNPVSLPLRYLRCFGIVCGTPEYRHAHVLQLTLDVAASLVVVGSIFLGLCIAGEFPASVETMKYVGTYAENIAKYSMYVWTGLMGCTATLVAAYALRCGTSLVPALTLFYLANISVLVCVGLSCYLLAKGAEMGMEWWMYLLSAAMIVQRCLYFAVAGMSCYSLHRAKNDPRVWAVMAGEVEPNEPSPLPTEKDNDAAKGEGVATMV